MKLIIIGAGFAGMYAALSAARLRDIQGVSPEELEILGPLKGKIWRIGLMGASATPWHVRLFLTALCDALCAQGYKADAKAALAAIEPRLAG